MRNITCCFTGHRLLPTKKLEEIKRITREQIRAAYGRGYRRFLCGGALGYDTLCAIEVIGERKLHPDIKLILVYPCLAQDAKWNSEDRALYKKIYDECDECYCMGESYTPYCMHLRNRAMVNDSSLVIAYLEKDTGGTAYTWSYAQKQGLRTVNINDLIGG